ncbi:unnamed protein product [Lampetra planeri]
MVDHQRYAAATQQQAAREVASCARHIAHSVRAPLSAPFDFPAHGRRRHRPDDAAASLDGQSRRCSTRRGGAGD